MLKGTIETIQAPMVLIKVGSELIQAHLKDFKGSPRVNVSVEGEEGKWSVVGNNVNQDCIGSVCPIR